MIFHRTIPLKMEFYVEKSSVSRMREENLPSRSQLMFPAESTRYVTREHSQADYKNDISARNAISLIEFCAFPNSVKSRGILSICNVRSVRIM